MRMFSVEVVNSDMVRIYSVYQGSVTDIYLYRDEVDTVIWLLQSLQKDIQETQDVKSMDTTRKE